MMLKEAFRSPILAAAGLTIAVQLAGCAMENPILSSGPYPRVEDCMIQQQATPTKYVCGGKVYTAVQLSDIRDGKTPAH
jgi:hypothetical protein